MLGMELGRPSNEFAENILRLNILVNWTNTTVVRFLPLLTLSRSHVGEY